MKWLNDDRFQIKVIWTFENKTMDSILTAALALMAAIFVLALTSLATTAVAIRCGALAMASLVLATAILPLIRPSASDSCR